MFSSNLYQAKQTKPVKGGTDVLPTSGGSGGSEGGPVG
jgi:hypothetical protein